MINLTAKDRSGSSITLQLKAQGTLMEAIRDSGMETEFALCGGSCSCATCHVVLDQEHFADLPPASEDELDLLNGSDARQPTSRLSCQIHVSDILDGATVTVAPGD